MKKIFAVLALLIVVSAENSVQGQAQQAFEPEMVKVIGGTFKMGSNFADETDNSEWKRWAQDEKPVHDVTLSTFSIGKYPITQVQWVAVMGSNPSFFEGDSLPVESVTWEDVQLFLKELNAITGKKYRLPTEAEWEFAARGGDKSQRFEYSGSHIIDKVAWYLVNSGDKQLVEGLRLNEIEAIEANCRTHAVGTKLPNELGIYDMSGNVWEWCSDWYGAYTTDAQYDPQGAISGSYRVCRGGSWLRGSVRCRIAYRSYSEPSYRYGNIGFRVVLAQ